MRILFSNLLRGVTVLGAIAGAITLVYVAFSGKPLLHSDDPYVLSFAVVACLVPSTFFYIVAEYNRVRFWFRVFWVSLPFLLIAPFLTYGALYGELHASAISMFMLIAGFIFLIPLVVLLHYSARSHRIRFIVIVSTVFWLLGYMSVFLAKLRCSRRCGGNVS